MQNKTFYQLKYSYTREKPKDWKRWEGLSPSERLEELKKKEYEDVLLRGFHITWERISESHFEKLNELVGKEVRILPGFISIPFVSKEKAKEIQQFLLDEGLKEVEPPHPKLQARLRKERQERSRAV